MAARKEPVNVVLTDPRAIRALAHPARMAVIDALYDSGDAMTATQLGELAGLSPSAMSYHLRSLERFGVVLRVEADGDGRERPWRRAGEQLSVDVHGSQTSRASHAAASTIVSMLMERNLVALQKAQEREIAGDTSVPLDKVTRYQRHALVLTVREGKALLRDINALLDPYRKEVRREPHKGAGELTVTLVAVPE